MIAKHKNFIDDQNRRPSKEENFNDGMTSYFRPPPYYMIDALRRLFFRCALSGSFSHSQLRAFGALRRNYSTLANEKRRKAYKKYGIGAETYVIGITDRCNLKCKYCYSNSGNKDFHDIDMVMANAVIKEIKEELGIYLVTISGGETFPRVLDFAERHRDITFFVYSNGTLITKEVAKRLRQLGNIIPAISIVGKKDTHEIVRGQNSYDKMIKGVENLNAENLIWGFSITESRINVNEILDGSLIQLCSRYNPFFIRMIPYVCEGREITSLTLSAQDRMSIGHAIERAKKDYDFIIYDYINDKSLGISCLAGGNRYFYINPKMVLTPCVFMDVGATILYDPKEKRTNVIKLLKGSRPMVKARKMSNTCANCIVQEYPDWKDRLLAR